jgi:hypothetical protein
MLACLIYAGCLTEPSQDRVLHARLFKNVEDSQPIELASGSTVADGEELFLMVETGRPLLVYVLTENISMEGRIIYPCSKWSYKKRFQTGLTYRLPPKIFGSQTFWPMQGASPHERLMVIGSTKVIDDLEASIMAADTSQPCSTRLTGNGQAWVDSITANLGRRSRVGRSHTWRVQAGKNEIWISIYDLKGKARRV